MLLDATYVVAYLKIQKNVTQIGNYVNKWHVNLCRLKGYRTISFYMTTKSINPHSYNVTKQGRLYIPKDMHKHTPRNSAMHIQTTSKTCALFGIKRSHLFQKNNKHDVPNMTYDLNHTSCTNVRIIN